MRRKTDANKGCDLGDLEVTVTSELHAQAERTKLRERAQGHSLYYREERRVASEERDVGFYSEDREATQTGGIRPK